METSPLTLRPVPYLESLAHYFKAEEPETWAWFASGDSQSNYAESLRVELLKRTYRLEPLAYPALFAALAEAKAKLGLTIPVTLYQSQSNREHNAALHFLSGEAHIVFQGDILKLLDPTELRGLLGHELAHYMLWTVEESRFFFADRMAQAMANDERALPSHLESARLNRLYTEIYADRGALLVTGDPIPVISGLIKIQTGLSEVDAASYVRQAEEVFLHGKVQTEGLSHPEAFIRARSVMLWSEGTPDVDIEVTRMIEGTATLDRLDLLGQQRLTDLTRRWLQILLRPKWFRTDAVQGHARLFFPDFTFPVETHQDAALMAQLREAGPTARDYFCYLLLDFAAVDAELELEPLREGFKLIEGLEWESRLETLIIKNLKLKKREVRALRAGSDSDEAEKKGEDENE